MDDNYFLYNPIKVNIYDVVDTNFFISKQLIILGGVPNKIYDNIIKFNSKSDIILKKYYGPSWKAKLAINTKKIGRQEENDFEDINFEDIINNQIITESNNSSSVSLYKAQTSTTNIYDFKSNKGGIIYNNDVMISIKDSIQVFKFKLASILNTPVYKFHISNLLGYEFTIDNEFQILKIDELFNNSQDQIEGIPVSRMFYNNADLLNIKANDHQILLESLIELKTFLNIDLYQLDIFFKDKSKIQHISESDPIQKKILFYSFIYKYYPIITLEMFEDYIINEKIMVDKYPDLFKSDFIYKKELKLQRLNVVVNDDKFIDSFSKINITLKSMINLNIWNIFDLINISMFKQLQYVQYFTSIDNNNVSFTKINKYVTQSYSSSINTQESIIFYFDNQMSFSISVDGSYLITVSANEGVIYTISEIVHIISGIINPIINYINEHMNIVNSNNIEKLLLINKYTIENIYGDFYIVWNTSINDQQYNSILSKFGEYVDINYFSLATDGSYNIHHGMNFFSKSLNIDNDFLYYSDAVIKKKWESIMNTKSLKLHPRNINLFLELNNINVTELDNIKPIILRILSSINLNNKDVQTTMSSKLKHIDPVLYNFKSTSKTKYSRYCQKPNQPIIVSKDKSKTLKNVLEYTNFTTNEKAYYYCPNKKFPFVKFLPNVHPNNLCIPCCKKKILEEQPNYKQCINNFKYEGTPNKVNNDTDENKQRYIINYNLDIEFPDRIMTLPPDSLELIFNNKHMDVYKYYIYGIQQNSNNIPSYAFLMALSKAWGTTIDKFIKYCIDFIVDNKPIFNTLLKGVVQQYFNNVDDLIFNISNIFMLNKLNMSNNDFDKWEDLFIEIITYMNTQILIFEEIDGKIIFTNNYSISNIQHILQLDLDFIVIIKKNSNYNLIVYTSDLAYYHNNDVQLKFKSSEHIIKQCVQLINSDDDIHFKIELNLNTLLHFIKEVPDISIHNLFVNRNNLAYGVLLNMVGKHVYLGINESICINIDIKKNYSPYDRSKYDTSIDLLISFIHQYNNFILSTSISANIINDKKMNEYMNFIKINNNFNDDYFNISEIRSIYDFIHIERFIILGNINNCELLKYPVIGVIVNGLSCYFNNTITVEESFNLLDNNIARLKENNISKILCREFKLVNQTNDNVCELIKYNKYYTHELDEPFIIQNAFMHLSNNDVQEQLYLEALYDMNIYNLLLFKIILYYKSNKNKYIRDIIYKHLAKIDHIDELNNYTNNLYMDIFKKLNIDKQLMKEIYDEIYSKLNNLHHNNDDVNIKNYFNNNIFKFDGLEIENFKYLTKHEVYEKLSAIIFNIVEINDKKNILHNSNKLIFCEDKNSLYSHCKNNKILINDKITLNNLLDLISYDFTNPFKKNMITSLSYIDPIIDKFIFTHYINQKIYVNIY